MSLSILNILSIYTKVNTIVIKLKLGIMINKEEYSLVYVLRLKKEKYGYLEEFKIIICILSTLIKISNLKSV
jgi:hypothetical protein